ncbi:hypothetical protein D3C72_1883410 [compost metagenome]
MLHYARRTCACGIEQNFVETVLRPGLLSDILFEVFVKKCHIFQCVMTRVLLPFFDQRIDAFYTDYACRALRQWQRKIPHAAKQVEYPIIRLNIKPLNRFRNHLLVNTVVHLNKISRTER